MRAAPRPLPSPSSSARLRPALAISLLWLTSAAFAASPQVAFPPSGPVVEAISAGATVSTLVVARIPLGDSQKVRVVSSRATAPAGETKVNLEWDGDVPPRAIFLAVDGTTAEWAAKSPGAALGVPLEVLPETVQPAGSSLSVPGGWLAVLVVRPGGGAWVAKVADGTQDDADGRRNEVVTLTPASLQPIEPGGPALTSFEARDVLLAIEIDRFQVATVRVGGAL